MARPSLKRVLPGLLLAAALPLAAIQKSVVIPLFPASRWQWISSTKLALPDLQKYGNEPAVDREFGAHTAAQRTYRLGSTVVPVNLEEAPDPSSAYGLYTLYQSEGMTAVTGIQMAVANSKDALMARGRYFIRVLQPPGHPLGAGELRSLLATIGGARLSIENSESLPASLPQQGLVPGSEKYLLGIEAAQRVLPSSFPVQLIGFEDGVEAHVGTYVVKGGNRLTLCEISYPTPQIAQVRFSGLKTALHLDERHGPGSAYGRQEGSYVFLVLNSRSSQMARELLGQFKVAQAVSWSPPYPGKGGVVYQMLFLIVSNVELVAIISIFAIVGGVLIFLTRRLIMKMFPNVSWLRPDEDELIRLKLT